MTSQTEHNDCACIACSTPGLVMDESGRSFRKLERHGLTYWEVTEPIHSLFGSEVEGELRAIGYTKEQALQHLKTERDNLYESLWV